MSGEPLDISPPLLAALAVAPSKAGASLVAAGAGMGGTVFEDSWECVLPDTLGAAAGNCSWLVGAPVGECTAAFHAAPKRCHAGTVD